MTAISNINYYHYWGKANKEGDYHLLAYHCLDVAAVAEAYLNTHPHFLNAIAFSLGFTSEQSKALILFMITLHDLGKFSICFQSKLPEILGQLLPSAKARDNTNYRHDELGQGIWLSDLVELFIQEYGIWEKDPKYINKGFNSLMSASTGHHGQPTLSTRDDLPKRMAAFNDCDRQAVKNFYADVGRLFLADKKFDLMQYANDDEDQNQDYFERRCKRLSWWLSGLTILADWLGSNTDYFPYKTGYSTLEDYWAHTQLQAKKALQQSGLRKAAIQSGQTFQTLFDKKDELRPLQALTATISLAQTEQLFVLEDITGSGKTEAALLLAYRLMEAGLADGIYFALPTMATANGIYDRLQCFYQKFFQNSKDMSIVLAHANSMLSKEFQQSLEDNPLRSELTTATAYCNAWFVDNRKKALLANVGVGTIDQALQSILPNKHQSLRILGLFRKILIIDEVHAYDTYMQTLLCNLLKFHVASGGSIILLSATLPQKIRKNLIEAFYEGRDKREVILKDENAYPLLTHANYETVSEIPVQSTLELKRSIGVDLIDARSEIDNYILSQLNQGYCVCWIRNTVHDAIEAYETFKSRYAHEKTLLFHARFTVKDRMDIENSVKKLFGKGSTTQERQGQLLIATQVVEQSLDLDFDCMVTDLAPIDLIIQRAGRLQRHHNDHGKRPDPVLIIYGPLPNADIKSTWYSGFFSKACHVYPNHAQLWIGANLLADKKKLIMPDDARSLIESVYADDAAFQAPECLYAKADKQLGKEKANKGFAQFVQLKLESGYCRDTAVTEWSMDLSTSTRLNEIETQLIYLARYGDETFRPWYEGPDDVSEKERWQLSSLMLATHNLKTLSSINPAFDSSELIEQLPDKGKYSAVFIYQSLSNQWYLFSKEKMLDADVMTYTSERGLMIKSPEEDSPAEAGK